VHEFAIAEAVMQAAAQRAEGRRLEEVAVRIGFFRQVVPDSLAFAWQMLTPGTPLEGCTLVIEHVPAVVHCDDCGDDLVLSVPVLACPVCGGFEVRLLSGEEFLIATIDRYEEAG
jgi:hydrogenase nickel incorporation protein HypA/HybF